MKFKLLIDKEKDEELILSVHSANEFAAKIENLVLSYNENDEIFCVFSNGVFIKWFRSKC